MKPIKVKIVQCSGAYWYAPLIDQTIEVTHFDDDDFMYYSGSNISNKGYGYVSKRDCQYLNGMPAGHSQWYLMMKYVAAIYSYLTKHGIDTKDKGLISAAYVHIYNKVPDDKDNFVNKFLELHDKIARVAPIFERHELERWANLRVGRHWLGTYNFLDGQIQVSRLNAKTFHVTFSKSLKIKRYEPNTAESKG